MKTGALDEGLIPEVATKPLVRRSSVDARRPSRAALGNAPGGVQTSSGSAGGRTAWSSPRSLSTPVCLM